MPTPYRLSPAQRLEAASMYAKELSARQIAEHFGCSVQAVRNALKAAGVQLREKREARDLRDQFPTKQHAGKPKPVYRPIASVFDLAARA